MRQFTVGWTLLLLGLAIGSAQGARMFNKYLERPNLANLSNQTPGGDIEKWLETVKITPGSSIPSVLAQLEGLSAKETNQAHQEIFRFLISLATTDSDNRCQQYLFDYFLQIYKRVEEPRLSELLDFMDYYGREKFRACMEYERL